MKLVVDNVSHLPVGNVQDIGGALLDLANEIDEQTTTVVAVLVTTAGLAIRIMGETASHYELMGLFEAAKLNVFADDVMGDE